MENLNRQVSDWLSPMMIKELRQELRLRSFTFLFIAPQAFMCLAIFIQLMESGTSYQSGVGPTIFWITIIVPLVLLVPRRAFFSFQKEVQAELLELVLLTKLSAWNIVFGKWAALTAQGLLFLCAISPYVVLQYYLGDPNPMLTIEAIFLLFLGSTSIIAVGISASASGKERRGVNFLGGIFLFLGLSLLPTAFVARASSRGHFGSVLALDEYLVLGSMLPLGILLLLQVGATRIAPALENHAMRKRLLGLILLLVAGALFHGGIHNQLLVVLLAGIILAPVCMSSLFEDVHPAIVRRLVAKKQVASILSRPGWPGGVVFAVFIITLFILLFSNLKGLDKIYPFHLIVDLIGVIFMPYALMQVFFKPSRRNFLTYTVIQVALLLGVVLLTIARLTSIEFGLGFVLSFFPIFVFLDDTTFQSTKMFVTREPSYVVTFISLLLIYREFRRLCREVSAPNS